MTKVYKEATSHTALNSIKVLPKILAVAGVMAMAGCISAKDTGDLGSDPNYSAGYNDGCATANARVQGFDETITRNQNLFDTSDAYRAGWRSGHATCGNQGRKDKDVFGGEDRWYGSGTIGSPK